MGIGLGCQLEIVFELALVAVVGQVNTGIERFYSDAGESRDGTAPLGRIVAYKVIHGAGQRTCALDPGPGIRVEELHGAGGSRMPATHGDLASTGLGRSRGGFAPDRGETKFVGGDRELIVWSASQEMAGATLLVEGRLKGKVEGTELISGRRGTREGYGPGLPLNQEEARHGQDGSYSVAEKG